MSIEDHFNTLNHNLEKLTEAVTGLTKRVAMAQEAVAAKEAGKATRLNKSPKFEPSPPIPEFVDIDRSAHSPITNGQNDATVDQKNRTSTTSIMPVTTTTSQPTEAQITHMEQTVGINERQYTKDEVKALIYKYRKDISPDVGVSFDKTKQLISATGCEKLADLLEDPSKYNIAVKLIEDGLNGKDVIVEPEGDGL